MVLAAERAAMTIKYGKAKLEIKSEGCIDCGTNHSSGWTVAKKIKVQVGLKTFEAPVHRCADCENSNRGVG